MGKTKSDLLSAFGFADDLAAPAAAPVEAGELAIVSQSGAIPGVGAPVATPHALVLDAWSKRRGKDLLEEHGERLTSADLADGAESLEAAAADLLAAAYDLKPQLAPACQDTLRHEFLSQLLQTEDYNALHKLTALDELNAGLAACKFAEGLAGLRATRRKEPPKDDVEKEIQAIEAVSDSVREASAEVETLMDAQGAFGTGPGSGGEVRDPKRVAELYKRFRNNHNLRRIIDCAGRYRRLAQSKQRTKPVHGYDDMVGPDLGNDVGRLLPSELSALATHGLDDEMLIRLVHNQARVRELRSVAGEAKGPIMVAIDESGSMSGDRIHTAKALALAMAWVARHQRRWCCLLAWASAGERRHLILPPGKWDEFAVLQWLDKFFNGGTCFPLADMPAIWKAAGAPAGRTDILLVTDGVSDVQPQVKADFLAWKQESKARLHSIIIGERTAGELAGVSDEVHLVPDLDVTSEAVGRAVSI